MRWTAIISLLLGSVACDPGPPPAGGTGPAQTLTAGLIGEPGVPFETVVSAPLPDGISLRKIGEAERGLLIAELDPALYAPQLVASPATGVTPEDAITSSGSTVLIGSGFVMDAASLAPVGLLQVDGNVLSPVQDHGYTRILGARDGSLGVMHRSQFQTPMFDSALQVGPGIVEQGKLDISERDLQRPKYFRSFVAVCEQRWLVGVSLYPANLYTLGQTLLADIESRGYRCSDVVNLAGDRQAVLLINSARGTYHHGDPAAPKASLLGFRPK